MARCALRWLACFALACGKPPPPDCPSPIPSKLEPSTMEPLRWSDENGCIEISYHPVFREREQLLIAAVDQWRLLECRTTCFSPPVERATPESGMPLLYSIHFAELMPMSGEQSTTRIWYRSDTGQLDRALVTVDPALDDAVFRRAVLRGFGRALGFDTPMVESVLDASYELDALSTNDVLAFCSQYGVCR
jgi:hypothetical protein